MFASKDKIVVCVKDNRTKYLFGNMEIGTICIGQ